MTDPTGESAPSHEGTYLEPDPRDDEVLTMTRRQLRIIMREYLHLMLPSIEQRLEDRMEKVGKLYVRLDTIIPEEVAR